MKQKTLKEGIFDFMYEDKQNLFMSIMDIAESVVHTLKSKNDQVDKFFDKLADKAETTEEVDSLIKLGDDYLQLVINLEEAALKLKSFGEQFGTNGSQTSRY